MHNPATPIPANPMLAALSGPNPYARTIRGDAGSPQGMEIEDLTGQRIQVRKPSPVAIFNLVAAVGDRAANQAYMAMVSPLLTVASINGEPVAAITTMQQLETLIERLGHAGVQAVTSVVLADLGKAMNANAARAASGDVATEGA